MKSERRNHSGRRYDWWARLRGVFARRESHKNPAQAARAKRAAARILRDCLEDVVRPALQAVGDHLSGKGLSATVDRHDGGLRLTVVKDEANYCIYEVNGRMYHKPSFAFPNLHGNPDRPQYPMLHIECEGLSHEWSAERCTYEDIYEDALARIHRWLEW